MSTFRIPSQALDDVSNDARRADEESSSEDEDDTWEDWIEDEKQPCKSLFDETTLPSVAEALEHDKKAHGFDLNEVYSRLALDTHQRIRLVNYIRKEKPSPADVKALIGKEEFLREDKYLIPVIGDDPMLQLQSDDWSDDEEVVNSQQAPEDLSSAQRKIRALENALHKAQQDLSDYRSFVGDRLNLASLAEALQESAGAPSGAQPVRDDDSHYFQSYGSNDIHAVMIQDKVRTATYATFILTTPEVFRDAVVLDVGCGTGILSLFAARAGAKRVFAVDASDIADKAQQIVKANGFEHVITVVRGKVEDITLPDGVTQVDIIVSEWMGYALLYESMLDSVLHARDRFLRPGGVMAPSETRMMLGLCEAGETFKERVEFWSDIYGFDLSAMATDVYEDAIVDIVGGETLVSEPVSVKDLFLREITAKQLDFTSPFRLVATCDQRTKIHALVLYFDTFFTEDGARAPADAAVHVVREGDPVLAEVWQLGGRRHMTRRMSSGEGLKPHVPKVTSFSTGPRSEPTHWKQTLFLLREPIVADEGTAVEGVFMCRKSADNTRELDVEIHYRVSAGEGEKPGEVVVQTYKVR
ncbi:methyltransferase domain-containing protein [Phanerochaete sordida]|uniref:type I protein arginine methyltransferase n=1 Tax=Phanerochaete sordida TaxID=48140 RepID=A0A9P3GF58_9APHY|nr:methyltransferase domain-containing protein [Phanerochaete sordida]